MRSRTKETALAILVQDVSCCRSVPRPGRIKGWVRHALGERTCGELTVRVVGEAEATRLNERYRHRRGATNVLAFQPADTSPATADDPPPIGDLVICAPVLEREAAEQQKPLEDHWAHIAIHGALHLLGYDHQTQADAEVMEAKEIELLQGLGIGDPYAEDA